LRGEDERAVRVRRDRRQHGEPPPRPPAAAALEGALERQVRQRAREEEEAVHPAVDAVEEERPAPGGERGGAQSRRPAAEARAERSTGSGPAATSGRGGSEARGGGLRVGETVSVTIRRLAGPRTLAPRMPLLALSGRADLRVQMPARTRFRALPAHGR